MFRDALLVGWWFWLGTTLVVMSGYLSYCWPSISSKDSGHSNLTITRYFHSENCWSVESFTVLGPFSGNPRESNVGKSQ